MTTTLQIPNNVVAVADSVNYVTSAVLANFILVASESTPDLQKATYRYSAGSAEDTLTVDIQRRYDVKSQRTYVTLTCNGLQKETDAEGIVTYLPITSRITYDHAGRVVSDVFHVLSMVHFAFTLLLGNAGTAIDFTGVVDAINHGIVTSLTKTR